MASERRKQRGNEGTALNCRATGGRAACRAQHPGSAAKVRWKAKEYLSMLASVAGWLLQMVMWEIKKEWALSNST